jgi:hypothetical protein
MDDVARTATERLDWESAEMHPMTVDGFKLVVRGTSRVPMTVKLRPMPLGIAPEDYRGIEVLGTPGSVSADVRHPWTAEIDTSGISGRRGVALIGSTMREWFPPKDE